MKNRDISRRLLSETIDEMNNTIDCLYLVTDPYEKNRLLNRLRSSVSKLHPLKQTLADDNMVNAAMADAVETTRVFTPAELAQYNGHNGNPAYVAVDGTVYDVSNIGAWTGGSHFGSLMAGRNLTGEFKACHGRQSVLNPLTVVGKMAE